MGGITLVISAIQLWLCHKSEEQKVYTPLKILVKVALCKTFKVKVSCDDRIPQANERNNKNQNAEKFDDPISWNDVSSAIDFAMFLIYVFVYFISTSTIKAFLKNW